MSGLYCFLRSRHILQELILKIEDVYIQPYLLRDITYPIHPYLLKGYKTRNNDMVNQIWFNQVMNKGGVLIENAFGILKNQWKILKNN